MAIKTYKPTTPSRRHMTVSAFEGIDKKAKPERSLTEVLQKHGGRNSYGRITVRHHGGGNKRKYRVIDFKRQREDNAVVVNLQYDPNRSANVAMAVKHILDSKTFDNGTICASEQSVVVTREMERTVTTELQRQGASIL